MPRPASVTATRAARDGGIRRSSLLHHFRSKAHRHATVFAEVLADLRSRYAQAIIPPASHHHRLARLCGDLARISHLLLGAPRGRSVERAAS